MKTSKKILIAVLLCIGFGVIAYFAWVFPFYEFESGSYDISFDKLFSLEYFKTLIPLLIIIGLSAVGIFAVIKLRQLMLKRDKRYSRFLNRRKSSEAPKQKPVIFMIVRWVVMIVFSFIMIWGGLIFGLRMSSLSIPLLSCPWNTEQMTESSCYYLSHLNELFELPIKSILLFVGSTLLFIILLGRAICGFLCPMGLIQDIMDKIRRRTKTEGISNSEKLRSALTPIKWAMTLLFIGLCFIGGNFCNFCPAVAVSPILAGVSTSLYVSGFFMIFVLISGFFKRRFFCNICPLGYIIGLFHKLSLFRIKKDCTACSECGACYEACPMGIKTIYTERGRADVTDANCIMCGECVKCCPEDKALSLTCAGLKLYTSSRKDIMSGYSDDKERRKK